VKYLFIISLFLSLFFTQCTESLKNRVVRNDAVIADDTLVQVLLDIALMNSYLKNSAISPKEKSKQSTQLYLGVLAKNKITKARLDSTYSYYRDHFEDFQIIFDSTKNQLKKLKVEYNIEFDSLEIKE
jgi:hypothetical protein